MDKIRLPLPTNKGNLFLDKDSISEKKEKLESFISDEDKMKQKSFAWNVLCAKEVQSNNWVEGYYDDISKIKRIVKEEDKYQFTSKQSERRILNLHDGYNMILDGRKNLEINEENLKALYAILSKDLLSKSDLDNMGEYYRTKPVYIYYSSNVTREPDMGINESLVNERMQNLFGFINDFTLGNTKTDEYIKSQILHYYFVYIHPYFDINGRTSRTTAIWYLVNQKAYPYVIFNRGIELNKSDYYKVIKDVKDFGNITFFVNYMMDTVYEELKKEHILESIISLSNRRLTPVDQQTIHYLLSMKGNITVKDFIQMYNSHNKKKKLKEIHNDMILPLVDKEIILPGRKTGSFIDGETQNYCLSLNPKYIDDSKDISNIKILKKETD